MTQLQLPKALREQFEPEQAKKTRRRKPQLSRKESRKQERLQKKQRKSEHFSHSVPTVAYIPQKRPTIEDGPPRKKHKVSERKEQPNQTSRHPLTKESPKQLAFDPALLLEDDPDDAEIARLEKLLGRKKRDQSGGFDSLLQDLDGFVGEDDDPDADESNGEDEPSSEPEVEASQSHSEEGCYYSDDLDTASNASDESEWGGIVSPDRVSLEPSEIVPETATSSQTATSNATKYVPPHLRLRQLSGEDKESLIKVKRNLKGMLNRLTEQNIASILFEIEVLSRNERRHDIIVALTELILDSLASSASLSTSFMVLHAALVGAMYRVMGVDFAAHFVTELITKYERQYRELISNSGNQEETGKECANLLLLLSELYILQVISCVIVFDIIRELLKGNLHEAEVELLLKLVRGCGPRLRQDDPDAIKDIHDMMTANISEKQVTISSRSKFMLETVGNLKNNKIKRLGISGGEMETAERLKKFLSGLNKNHHLKSHEPLRFTLSDIHSSDTKGKWWLVGAAWAGDPLNDRPEQSNTPTRQDVENEKLLRLARKQGMNTDIRRSIFLVLMTSEDYLDAHERLTGLHLNEIQQREMIRVLFHCSGSENNYNPYYTLIAQQLCSASHSHKVTLQYCLWDFLRDLGEETVGGAEIVKAFSKGTRDGVGCALSKLTNIARAMAWWIAKDAVSLTVFKPLDFAVIQPQTQNFLEIFFEQLFVSSQVTSPVATEIDPKAKRDKDALTHIFKKALKLPELSQGLLYIVPSILKQKRRKSDFLTWAIDNVKLTLRSGVNDLEFT